MVKPQLLYVFLCAAIREAADGWLSVADFQTWFVTLPPEAMAGNSTLCTLVAAVDVALATSSNRAAAQAALQDLTRCYPIRPTVALAFHPASTASRAGAMAYFYPDQASFTS